MKMKNLINNVPCPKPPQPPNIGMNIFRSNICISSICFSVLEQFLVNGKLHIHCSPWRCHCSRVHVGDAMTHFSNHLRQFFHLKRNEITFFIPSVRFHVDTNVANENRWHHLDSINSVHSHTHTCHVRDNEMFIFTRSKSVHKLKSIEEVHWLVTSLPSFPLVPSDSLAYLCQLLFKWSLVDRMTDHYTYRTICYRFLLSIVVDFHESICDDVAVVVGYSKCSTTSNQLRFIIFAKIRGVRCVLISIYQRPTLYFVIDNDSTQTK